MRSDATAIICHYRQDQVIPDSGGGQ